MKKLQRLELLKDFVQEAVDRGATSVEAIHQYIADLPFEALEATGLLDRDKSALRAKHQRTIGAVYGAIRRINREIGQLLSDQFENVDEAADVRELFARMGEPTASAAAPEPAVQKPVQKPAPKPVRKAAAKKPAVRKAAAAKPATKKAAGRKTAAPKTRAAR